MMKGTKISSDKRSTEGQDGMIDAVRYGGDHLKTSRDHSWLIDRKSMFSCQASASADKLLIKPEGAFSAVVTEFTLERDQQLAPSTLYVRSPTSR
ncbi:hypothetical protein FQA47_023968 [Oryzias melastigma]|uniref:Uncharacterized protein n=1 Tax=Oryzias melastigma TaxID=30732 RepID=A0A834L317_ORYME|nr:hypothetical protein FQA47_023968 [Oryzias melastigma]